MTEKSLLSLILKVILGTPTWVWFIFGYLVFVGIRAIHPRIVYIPKLFIIPLVLSSLKYKVFISSTLSELLSYFICLLLSSLLSYKYSKGQKVRIIKGSMSVKLPGTCWTLIVLMLFFVIKYFFGYISVTNPIYYEKLLFLELGISGLFSGYFLGKATLYLNYYRKE